MADLNDLSPTSIGHLVGQDSVRSQVTVALDYAFAEGKRFEHSLLVGMAGCGKTATAHVIAAEMCSNLHEYLGQSLSTVGDLNAALLNAGDKDVVFIDEAHELAKPLQTRLFLAMDQKVVFANGSKTVQKIPLRDFTLLLASTDEFCVLSPLRDRCRLVLRFGPYSEQELTTLLQQRSRAIGWEIDPDVFPLIASKSRGIPRLSIRLLQATRRCLIADGEQVMTRPFVEKACQLEGIDTLGLGPVEQQYLRILADGNTKLNVLASTLGLPSRTVSQVQEPYLIRSGLVAKDDQGRRQLTAKGREHLANLCADST